MNAELFRVSTKGKVTIVTLADETNRAELEQELLAEFLDLIQVKHVERLVVNFGETFSVSSGVLGCMIRATRLLPANRVVLCELPPITKQTLEVTHLDQILVTRESEDEAVAAVSAN